MATSLHKNFYPICQETNKYDRPCFVRHYYSHILSDLCLEVEKRIMLFY